MTSYKDATTQGLAEAPYLKQRSIHPDHITTLKLFTTGPTRAPVEHRRICSQMCIHGYLRILQEDPCKYNELWMQGLFIHKLTDRGKRVLLRYSDITQPAYPGKFL